MAAFLADEHVPGPFVAVLGSLGHDVARVKNVLREGADDGDLIEYAASVGRIVITCDRRSTLVDGTLRSDHQGVIYADQSTLQARPEDAASGVERLVSTITSEAMDGNEFYLSAWL